ncbi:MAG: bifunctional uridylyltransferase/uridylyl-removing protein GlnD [Lonepinella koalarum]|nr:bifunctional uridylyltransferase/uridylyl-removing protein GlnD [Lonepinella koalarum]
MSVQLTPSLVKQQREALKQQELVEFAQADIHQLIAKRTQFYDELLIQLWSQFGITEHEIALIAVGGYGRKEMFPLSDVDFLILRENIESSAEGKIEQFIQFLWDCGIEVGASVRCLTECEEQGKADITIATNLLESRFLVGNKNLFEKLTALLWEDHFWPRECFFNAKVAEKIERYQRYNNTSYNLEPDIKYNPGGLRDLHLIYWVALRHSKALTLEEILQSGFIYAEEYFLLRESQSFLFKVRFALHLILKRYDNRLLFDRQLKVAELLGYQGEGNQGVEQMMKAFFQALQTISGLSEVLTKHYREHFLATEAQSAVKKNLVWLDDNFALQNDSDIVLMNEQVFSEKPDTMLDLFFHLTANPQAEIHSATLRKLYIALSRFNGYLSDIPVAREKFVRLFAQPNAIRRAIEPMHKIGVLTTYLPQWKGIEGLMQFDLFHTYTVDEHSVRLLLKLEGFAEIETEHPICSRIFSQFSDRTLLYITALFHDIAKGRGGDHAELGASEVYDFALRHGFERREAETMRWLVEQHLLMSITAQRRDIQDPEVVMAFAEEVQNKVRLDLLLCLTVADICATNHTLWNSWKRSLFNTLYQSTLAQFEQGIGQLMDNRETIQNNRIQALCLLEKNAFSTEKVTALWRDFPDEYFLRNSPQEVAWHTELLLNFKGDCLVKISNRFTSGGTELFIYCADQTNLFNKVVSTIGAKKCSIHDAQIITTQNGYVLDSFIVTELDGSLLKFDRRRQLEMALSAVLRSDKLPPIAATRNTKLAAFQVNTEIRFLHLGKKEHTEMELFALDQAGLLAEVSQVFNQLKLNLIHAKITTIGAKAEDFFILTNRENRALDQQEREQLKQRLKETLC